VKGVSEWTLNLIHSSNPISTVGLRDSSPTSMRSTRVGGRTHSRVVVHFLREQEERRSSLRKEAICRAKAHIPRQFASTQIEVTIQQQLEVVQYGFLEVVPFFCMHRNRGGQQQEF
jgi:hypothetical protein